MVYLLTEQQKNLLIDTEFIKDNFFNPIQDKNDNWVISDEEVNSCENEAFLWVKDLPIIDFEPKIIDVFKMEMI